MDIQSIKQRFGIIGNSPLLHRAIDIARQVASTDLTVLITGESGTGKEFFPKIIHQLSSKKHGQYIAVNCGAIPEGTIDSELFGHEKGSFTGANESRKGYFEVANGGTIFLDEVAELPLSTQVRLLRVLEGGEFLKVGSSKVIKTNVRVVAATNVELPEAIKNGKFRQDLFYRLNTVPIFIPALKDRKEDIILLFKKFASDFAEKYRMPPLQLSEEAKKNLINYRWQGNIRQLKNITEQLSIIEKERFITGEIISKYLPYSNNNELPVLFSNMEDPDNKFSERDLLYKVLFDMRKDINYLKKIVTGRISNENLPQDINTENNKSYKNLYQEEKFNAIIQDPKKYDILTKKFTDDDVEDPINNSEIIEESLSIEKKEIYLIKKSLEKHKGKRKDAAKDLEISERTLYRKIKEYNIK